MRRRDWADDEADHLYEMVRDGADDEKVIDAIASALREAAGIETPQRIDRVIAERTSKGRRPSRYRG